MQINHINNVNFNGKIWLAGKFTKNTSELKEIANSPEKFKEEMQSATEGIHFDTRDAKYISAINQDICVLHIYDKNDTLKRAVVPYNLEFILSAYNAAKDGLDVDLRRADKETYIGGLGIVIPHDIQHILKAYNDAKEGPNMDLRNAGKETYLK